MRKNKLIMGSIVLITLALVGGLFASSPIYAQDDAQSYLGVRYQQTDEGAVVVRVVVDSPADEAGLQRGDLIAAVNGDSTAEEGALSDLVSAFAPGDEIILTVNRDDESLELTVVLGDAADAGFGIRGFTMDNMPMMPFFDGDFNLEDHPMLGEFIVENEDGSYTIKVPPGFEGMMPFGGRHMQPGDGRLWIFPDGGMDRDWGGRGSNDRGHRGGGRGGMFQDEGGMFMLPWLDDFDITVDRAAGTIELLLPDMEAPIVIPMGAMMDADFDWDAFLAEHPELADILPEDFDPGEWFGGHGGMFGFRYDFPDSEPETEEAETAEDVSTSA